MNCGKDIDCRTCFAELGDDIEKCEYWQEKKVVDAEARMELALEMGRILTKKQTCDMVIKTLEDVEARIKLLRELESESRTERT